VFEEQHVCIILPIHILFDHADLLLLFYALPLLFFTGSSHLAGLFVGPMDRILVTIVIVLFAALVMFVLCFLFVLFCQFTFYLTTPIYCYYFMPCLAVLYGNFPFGRLICRSNGPYFSHDSHIVLFAALLMFVLCFHFAICVSILLDHPFIGTVSNALGTVTCVTRLKK